MGAMLCGCTALQSRSLKEVVMMATKDGDRVLREPMRPARDSTRVLIFALDGVGYDQFLHAVRNGRMPSIAALFGKESETAGRFAQAYAPPSVLSVLPSSTMAAWTSSFTGSPPAETGVPGNEWFDRADTTFHAPGAITTDRRFQVVGNYNEDLLGRDIHVPTLYERASVRSYVSLNPVYKGADLLGVPEVEPFGTLFNAGLLWLFKADSAQARLYEKLDEVSIKSLDESLKRYGLADIQTIYFPGVDLFTHIAPDPIQSQQRYLSKVIDPSVARVLNMYRERGALENTFVLFVSDHGQTPVLQDEGRSLFREGKDEPPELLRRAGFRVRPRSLEIDRAERDFQAVIAMQGGMAYVYLADRSTCLDHGMPCDWGRPPREEDVLSVALPFYEANEEGRHLPSLQGTLDLILARTGAHPGSSPPFEVFDGRRLVSIGGYLEQHARPDLVALERRLTDLTDGPYGYLAGDVLLIPRMRLDEPVEKRAYFGVPYHTWHGSPNRLDSEVIFALAHPRIPGPDLRQLVEATLEETPSQMALTPLVLSLLEKTPSSVHSGVR